MAIILSGMLLSQSICAGLLPPSFVLESPRILALLEKAWALEHGTDGQLAAPLSAIGFYCEAARHGSANGHFQAGVLESRRHDTGPDTSRARFFLSTAMELGHPGAELVLRGLPNIDSMLMELPECLRQNYVFSPDLFDFSAYIAHLGQDRKQIALLIEQLAPEYNVPVSLALSIAATESNFHPRAKSPKNAMGVMQLIPETARRFKVKNPLDPEATTSKLTTHTHT